MARREEKAARTGNQPERAALYEPSTNQSISRV
jgi:hypothetical protein